MESTNKVLVCVTLQKNSIRLIKKGAKLANEVDGELHILHIEKGSNLYKNNHSAEILNELFACSSKENGFMHIELSQDIPKKINEFIKEQGISHVIMGQSLKGKLEKLLKKDIIKEVKSKAGNADILILEKEKQNEKKQKLFPLNQH